MKDSYYFSHDTNAFLDPKIRAIVFEFGVWSYAVFWIIIEMLASQKEYKIEIKGFPESLCPLLQGKKIVYGGAAGVGSFEDTKGKGIIDSNVGRYEIDEHDAIALFCMMQRVGLFKDDGVFFWSESLLERMKLREEKSNIYRDNANKRWAKNAIAMQPECNSSQGKERKGKERKEESTFTPPSLEAIQEYIKTSGHQVDAKKFYDYFTVSGWVDSKGKKVKNWKQKLITWASHNKQPIQEGFHKP